jgi:hypothetical protein
MHACRSTHVTHTCWTHTRRHTDTKRQADKHAYTWTQLHDFQGHPPPRTPRALCHTHIHDTYKGYTHKRTHARTHTGYIHTGCTLTHTSQRLCSHTSSKTHITYIDTHIHTYLSRAPASAYSSLASSSIVLAMAKCRYILYLASAIPYKHVIVCICVHMYVCIHTHMCIACMWIWMSRVRTNLQDLTWLSAWIPGNWQEWFLTYIYAYMNVCICVYIYVYIYIYILFMSAAYVCTQDTNVLAQCMHVCMHFTWRVTVSIHDCMYECAHILVLRWPITCSSYMFMCASVCVYVFVLK